MMFYSGGAEAKKLMNRAGESDRRAERAARFGGGGSTSSAYDTYNIHNYISTNYYRSMNVF